MIIGRPETQGHRLPYYYTIILHSVRTVKIRVPLMTKIYLIRHVQAEGNLFRMMQGHWDGEPTALGLRQAARLGERMRELPLDAIYVSDLSRALCTAAALQTHHPLPLRVDPRLRELDMGPWEGRFFGDLKHEHPGEIKTFLLRQDGWRPEGAEDYAAVTARAWPAMEEILRDNEGKSVAVVSHGVTIRCLLAKMLKVGPGEPERLPLGGNTAVSCLDYENGVFTPEYLGDNSHLDEAERLPWDRTPDLRAEAIDPLREEAFYTACYEDAWRAAHGTTRGFSPESYLLSAAEHHRADPGAVLRILAEDEPVGLVDMDTRRGAHAGYGWLSLLYLRPEYRRLGMGIQLLGRAIMHYRALERRSLRLTVAEDNAPAVAFYARWGFEQLGSEQGSFGRILLLEKKIGGPGYV